jgi:hypothetical protein
MKYIVFIFVFFFFLVSSIAAQTAPDDEDFQSWNDVQITVPMTKDFDFFTQLTARFGSNVSRLSDGRFAIGFTWKTNKSLSITPFYWNIRARNASGRFRQEHRLNLRAVYRFPVKKFGLSHRSTYEYRMRSPRNNWRYRASLNFEKDIPKKIIPGAKFFAGDEVFYDSLLKKFSRNRFTVGINKTLNKKLSVDIYFMRQNDGFSRPGDLNVVGTSFRVRL